ncbi:Single-stranded DNA-binding protein [Pseudomonas amygdali pv. myricae]|nr:Single-stranded DNA-binding protein [Pseudomonas amygdali pv. myricae]
MTSRAGRRSKRPNGTACRCLARWLKSPVNTCARGRRSTSRASCKPANGKRTVSSATPRKSSWTCRAPCSCSVAVHRATLNKGRTATTAVAATTRKPHGSEHPSRRHRKNRPARAKPHQNLHVHQASRLRPKRLHRNPLGILEPEMTISPSWTPTGSTGCWSDPPHSDLAHVRCRAPGSS